MSFTRFCFQSTLFIATTVIITCVTDAPSQAVELIFSSPNVISGINGVSFTLPSTGISRTYNVTLERGTVNDVYGTPPKFDVFNQTDAVAAMNASAQGINIYLANVSEDLSFESLGTDVFYIPYSIDPNNGNVLTSSSKKKVSTPDFIDVGLVDLPPDTPVVYTRLTVVPEPTSTLSLLALGTLGATSTFKRKLKSSKSTEKELTTVG